MKQSKKHVPSIRLLCAILVLFIAILSCNPELEKPIVVTNSVEFVTQGKALCKGTVSSHGGEGLYD